ncbi:MAG: GNAT family N-acetyltransferase [Pseudomonadota bacterium]
MAYLIREATRDDLPVLKTFEQGIIAYERPFDPTLRPDPISYYDIGEMIDSAEATVIVAESEGEVVASGYAKKKPSSSYAMPTYHAFLGMMFVRPEHRGKGVNGRVLNALLDWARRNDLPEVHLTVYPENDSARNAYLKAGFKPHILEMRMNIDD